jgi:diguanylate cyclase (GGDEF)-like protein/PAS domain S-box-containing protein
MLGIRASNPGSVFSIQHSRVMIISVALAGMLTQFTTMVLLELLQPAWSDLIASAVDAFSNALLIGALYFFLLWLRHKSTARSGIKIVAMLALAVALASAIATVEISVHPLFGALEENIGALGIILIDTALVTALIHVVVGWFEKLRPYFDGYDVHEGDRGKQPHLVALIAIASVLIITAAVNAIPGVTTIAANSVDNMFTEIIDVSGRQRMFSQRIGRFSSQLTSPEFYRTDVAEKLAEAVSEMRHQADVIDEKLAFIESRITSFWTDEKIDHKNRMDDARGIMLQNAELVLLGLKQNAEEVSVGPDVRLQKAIDHFLPLQEIVVSEWQKSYFDVREARNDLYLLWVVFSPFALTVIGFTALGPIAVILRSQEQRLKTRSEEYQRLITAIGHAKSAIILLDRNGTISWANPALVDLLSVEGEVIGRSLAELLESRHASPETLLKLSELVNRPERMRAAFSIISPSGLTLELVLEVELSEGTSANEGGFTAILRDRTERFNMRKFLRAVFEGAAQGIVIQRSDGEIIDANPEAERLLGLTLDQLKGLNSLDPRWRALDADGQDLPGEQHPAMIALRTNEPVNATIMGIEAGDGERRWLLVNCNLSVDPASSERIVIASFADVTQARIRESELEEANQIAQQSLSELTEYKAALDQHAIVTVTDASGRITYANQRFQQISGYQLDEVIGKTHSILNSRTHPKSMFGDMWRTIAQGNTWRGEICNRAKDGSLYWVDTTIIPTHDSGGSVKGYVSIRYDITNRVQALSELEESRALNERKTDLLEMTLAHMNQGISVYDKEGRIVIWNDKYVSMYEMRLHDVQAGMKLEELLNIQKAQGSFSGSPRDLIAEIRKSVEDGQILENTTRQRSGQLIKAIHSPTPEGGHVATHEDVTEREQAQSRISHAAHHDLLTGLPNRIKIRATIADALDTCRTDSDRFSVMLIDLDRFKAVNDTFGHAIGDNLLREVAKRMRANVRQDDVVARLGGDEFAIYFAAATDQETMTRTIAKRLVRDLCMPYEIDGVLVNIGASIGVAIAPEHGKTCDDLFHNADIALYHVKNNGRHGFRIFDSDLEAKALERAQIEADLHQAIANEAFELYFQPYYDITEERIVGAECLIRWNHPERGFIPPDLFIPIAEDTGLIQEIGDWVIKTAIHHAVSLSEDLKIAINVSAAQFGHGRLADSIIQALFQTRLDPERIEIEVTETVLLRDDPALIAELESIKALNISVALDDFGTGYSSLKHLKTFQFDKIKIDKSFVGDMSTNDHSAAIVAAITNMARSLGITVTAEGVETKDQLKLLRAAGCTFAQGFHLARPMPSAEFKELILSGNRSDAKHIVEYAI